MKRTGKTKTQMVALYALFFFFFFFFFFLLLLFFLFVFFVFSIVFQTNRAYPETGKCIYDFEISNMLWSQHN